MSIRLDSRLSLTAAFWVLALILTALLTDLAPAILGNSWALIQVRPIFDHDQPMPVLPRLPGNNPINSELTGIAYLAHGNPRQALPFLQQAVKANAPRQNTQVFIGQALYELGRVDEAATAWKVANASPWLVLKGMEAQQRLEFESALAYYQLSSRVDPENPSALRLAGDIHRYLGRWGEAAEAYRSAAALEQDPFDKAILIGQAALITADWDAALVAYQRASAIRPDRPEPLYWQGYIWYWGKGDFSIGKSLLQESLTLAPGQITTYVLIVQMCTAEQDYACADEWFNRGEAAAPGNIDLWLESARSFNQRKDYQRAVEIADRILKSSPSYIQAWQLKAAALLDSGQPLQARQTYQQALVIAPQNLDLLVGLAQALLESGEPCAALETANQVISVAPPSSSILEAGRRIELAARSRCNP